MAHKESHIQQTAVKWFRLAHRDLAPLFISIPNGMRMSETQARIAVAEGLTKGAADTFLFVPRGGYHGLAVEFKQETEEWKAGKRTLRRTYQRPEQKAWQAAVEGQGYRYAVCRSVDEFITEIENYLAI